MSKPTGIQQNTSNTESSRNGHRDRLRKRFVLNGFDGMLDYEVMETILTLVIPRKDVKPIARALLARFHNVSTILAQPLNVLSEHPGLGMVSATGLKIILEAIQYCLAEQMEQKNLLSSINDVKNFVRMKMGYRRRETVMLIFLDAHNQLISYSISTEGAVNLSINYVRNVEDALMAGACGVILVHNHPSGVCIPSSEDIASTYSAYDALALLGICLQDHLIVSNTDTFSFVENGLLLQKPQGDSRHDN